MDFETTAHPSIRRARPCFAFLLASVLAVSTAASAQEAPAQAEQKRTSFVVELVRDPTTYVPAGLLYTSMRLDWNSSQPFFQNGFVEENARYTLSGLPKDHPLSYSQGNSQILKDSLAVLPASFANNALAHMVERKLTDKFPQHRKLWKTLSWIERVSFATFASYRLAGPHLEQWKKNERLAREYGFVP